MKTERTGNPKRWQLSTR